jgi:hypothetical protein
MSPINFDTLATEHPDLAAELAKLQTWERAHQWVRTIDLRRLANEVRNVDARALARALYVLVDHGYLAEGYTVELPDGALAERVFDAPTDIPDQIPDRFARPFNTSEGRIVQVFRRTAGRNEQR